MSARQLANRFAATHELLLQAAGSCTDEDLAWRGGPTSPPIAFHAWHVGRWADRWAEALGAPDQVWIRDALAREWGFPDSVDGGVTGMQMPDDQAAALPFPTAARLTAYLRAAFARLENQLERVTDDDLLSDADDLLGRRLALGEALLRQLAHGNRHLGMIEALRGVRGSHGTATV